MSICEKNRANPSPAGTRLRAFCAIFLLVLIPATFSASSFARTGRTCGVDSLYQICLYYNLPIQYEEVYAACKPNDEGNSMYDLFQAAQKLGFSVAGMRLFYQELLKLDSPAIAFVRGDHFVSVLGKEGDKVVVVDYPAPAQLWSEEEFKQIWEGEVLVVSWEGPVEPEVVDPDAPRVRFEHTLQDFGVVSEGEKVEREYLFWNEGAQPLLIKRVESSCGCAPAVLSATELATGDIGVVSVELDTTGRRGRFTQYVSLLMNDPLSPQVQLTLSGIVKTELVYAPKQVYFGRVVKGEQSERQIILVDSGDGGLELLGVQSDSPFLSLSHGLYEDPRIKDGQERFQVQLQLQTERMDIGPFRSKVVILTNLAKRERIEIPVQGEVTSDLLVRPSLLFFGFVKAGETVERTVKLETVSRRPFQITSLEGDVEGLDLRYSPDLDGAAYSLKATFNVTEGGASGLIEGRVRVRTDLPEQSLVEIPVKAMLRG